MAYQAKHCHTHATLLLVEILRQAIFFTSTASVSLAAKTHITAQRNNLVRMGLSLLLTGSMHPTDQWFSQAIQDLAALEEFAKNADLLVGEIFDTELVTNRLRATNPDMSDHALLQMRQHFEEHHLTPEDLGKLASRAGVKIGSSPYSVYN